MLGLLPGTTYKVGIVTNSKDMTSKRAVVTFVTGGNTYQSKLHNVRDNCLILHLFYIVFKEPGMTGSLEFPHSSSSDFQMVNWKPSRGRADSYVLQIR